MKAHTYISDDGLIFEDPVDCARHELKGMKDFIQKLNSNLKSGEIRDYWCKAEICGCMGCLNLEFIKNGLSEYHYIAWKRDSLQS